MDIIKNPVVLGLTAIVLTYMYLTWTINNKKKNKNKKSKEQEEVNLLIPLVVGIIVWFIAYSYFEYHPEDGIENIVYDTGISNKPSLPLPIPPSPKYNFIQDVVTESSDPKSFSLLTKGDVNVPRNFPDVLLDIY